ncbi:MAG: HNH endonuclease [Planctomycetia bacterium]|nr:HNH endonuclease [Planctomycetia bacterium]
MRASLKRRVWQRASGACEYCRMPRRLYLAPYQIDHIIAEKHNGKTVFSNLALACYHCNLHKGSDISGKDPVTGRTTRLFHPRRDQWHRHFRWRGAKLVGRSAVGRATIAVLNINHEAYVLVRQALIAAGLFP